MATFNRRSWREVDRPEPLTPIPHPRGDAYYATTSERTDYGLRTGDPPLETDWPDIVRRKYAHELVCKIRGKGEILYFHSYMMHWFLHQCCMQGPLQGTRGGP